MPVVINIRLRTCLLILKYRQLRLVYFISLSLIYTQAYIFSLSAIIYILYISRLYTIVMVLCNDVFVFDFLSHFLSVILLLPRASEYLDLLLRLIL